MCEAIAPAFCSVYAEFTQGCFTARRRPAKLGLKLSRLHAIGKGKLPERHVRGKGHFVL